MTLKGDLAVYGVACYATGVASGMFTILVGGGFDWLLLWLLLVGATAGYCATRLAIGWWTRRRARRYERLFCSLSDCGRGD